MTEYELVDAIASYNDQGMSSVLAYFTVSSGYLVAAYLAGKAMTRSQVVIVSILFASIALLVSYSAVGSYSRSIHFWADLLILRPDSVAYLKPWLLYTAGAVLVGGVAASMKFMWDVRHPKAE